MEPTFGHPLWISSGVLMMLVGFLLFRWARRDDAAEHIAKATREAAVNKMLKGGGPPRSGGPSSKNLATHHFRRAMAQLFGIVGFLLIIAGLMAALLGMFYTGA